MTLRYINLLFSLTFTECADTVVAMYRLTGGGLLAAAATVAHSIRLACITVCALSWRAAIVSAINKADILI